MPDWDKHALKLVDNHIHVWARSPHLKPLLRVLTAYREIVLERVIEIFSRRRKRVDDKADEARAFILQYVLDRMRLDFEVEHLVLFKENETVRMVLEDAFGVESTAQVERVTFPYQEEVTRIVIRCLFPKRQRPAQLEDIVTFLSLFAEDEERARIDQEKVLRYKTMVWLAYLLIDLIRTDKAIVCENDVSYFRVRFGNLLDRAIDGMIIDESYHSREYDFEGGKWDDTLFGWLQGEDRRPLAEKLRKQFNLENRVDHANRMLLAGHRECMYRQAMVILC